MRNTWSYIKLCCRYAEIAILPVFSPKQELRRGDEWFMDHKETHDEGLNFLIDSIIYTVIFILSCIQLYIYIYTYTLPAPEFDGWKTPCTLVPSAYFWRCKRYVVTIVAYITRGYWQLNNEQILVIGFCHEPTSIMECHNYFDHCSSGWWFPAFFLNFHPELWGFMIQFWRLRIFCKWVGSTTYW